MLAPYRRDPPAEDAHGRPLSTTPAAAGIYRLAAEKWPEVDATAALLDGALALDPGFVLAAVARSVVSPGAPMPPPNPPPSLHRWERAHLEVVAAALAGRADRAGALLREHLADVGCDPFATAAVLAAVTRDVRCSDHLDDLVGGDRRCRRHPGVIG